MEQQVTGSELKGQLESITQQAEENKVILFVFLSLLETEGINEIHETWIAIVCCILAKHLLFEVKQNKIATAILLGPPWDLS